MALALWFFLLFASFYHVLVTVLVYGLGILQPEIIVILRESLWVLLLIISAIVYRKHMLIYLKCTRKFRLMFIAIVLLGVIVSYFNQKTITDMIVGAKYGLQFFVVFMTSIFIGTISAHMPQGHIQKVLHFIFRLLVGVITFGIVRQGSKMFWPELFYHIGYTNFGDRVFGHKPPLYYLTGPNGYPRFSGIFSGPNNYGYLFVGMLGFWRRYIRTYVKKTGLKTLLRVVFSFSVLATMSRGAIVGIFLQIIALSFTLFHAKRKFIWSLVIIGLLVVAGLSLLKRGSTLAHVRAKFSSLSYVRTNPLGYGLGSSGPSIHTGHGNILPENFFVQILIDIGIPGLILWLLFRYMILKKTRKISKDESIDANYRVLLMCLSFSFLGLLLEGMFLHVFEDSMVNYWFFILRGIVYGYVVSESWGRKYENNI